MDDNHFSVEDRLLDWDIKCIGDNRKAVGPVVTVAGVDLGTFVQVDLQAVAVIIDLVQPFAADGGLGFQRRESGRAESRHFRRHCAFDHPRDEAGLGTLGHTQLTKRQFNKKKPAA